MRQLLGIALIMVLTVGAMAAGAGIYKWLESTDTQEAVTEATTPVRVDGPNLNDWQIIELIYDYTKDLVDENGYYSLDARCLHTAVDGKSWSYNEGTDTWLVGSVGPYCQGLEHWLIDDSTGAVEYLGPAGK